MKDSKKKSIIESILYVYIFYFFMFHAFDVTFTIVPIADKLAETTTQGKLLLSK